VRDGRAAAICSDGQGGFETVPSFPNDTYVAIYDTRCSVVGPSAAQQNVPLVKPARTLQVRRLDHCLHHKLWSPVASEHSTINAERRRDDRRSGGERRAVDRRTFPEGPTACPKCGTLRTIFTAAVTSDCQQLSLFRCEVCHARFTSGARDGNPPESARGPRAGNIAGVSESKPPVGGRPAAH
jgi:hypothetical protein